MTYPQEPPAPNSDRHSTGPPSPNSTIVENVPDSAARRRDDRTQYDPEEQFAILYLMNSPGVSHPTAVIYFRLLFPPGTVRRWKHRKGGQAALTELYDARTKGALECRHYRLRNTVGMGNVRGADRDNERVILERLRRDWGVGEELVHALEAMVDEA
ncbi:hypothetical protein LTS18_004752 [Coniosporium uncinatum]|uniref:Uncharacterized protein n=1 Tax=Coniosporium uncinatum TaxID=93489 RepID=A0ACC3DSJ4_9PEZI|nr:hypothetical protein LTS18_004752 [Coniosporium uncinatum]